LNKPLDIHKPPLKHCTNCGTALEFKIPEGDGRERGVCPACGAIHYQNPKIVVGCVALFDEKILLCRRAIEPRRGFWTLPAGFMENGETTAEGAARETLEESGAVVNGLEHFAMIDVPMVNQVHMFYRGTLASDALDPGEESLEARFFHEDEIPWDDLAFHTVIKTLQLFFADRRAGAFEFHATALLWPPKKPG
jgi:ADP-ribose pyrophosphatase YjhB (NUDIX family)